MSRGARSLNCAAVGGDWAIYRLPAHGDNTTDDHDLEAIFRAAVNGFGLLEPVWDETHQHLQWLARHRGDLVEKRAKLQCQIRPYLERCLPGYAALFSGDDLWSRPGSGDRGGSGT